MQIRLFFSILKLYLETSVFGFYYDEESQNVEKREDTRALFLQIKAGPKLAIDSNGTLYLAYALSGDKLIVEKFDGSGWSVFATDTVYLFPSAASSPFSLDMVVDSNDRLIVALPDSGSGGRLVLMRYTP